MRSLTGVLRFLAFGLALSVALPTTATAEWTTTFGPVRLHPDQSFELCVSAPYSTQIVEDVQVSFHPVRNADVVIRSQTRALNPGEGGCVAVDFLEVGDTAIFAVLQTLDETGSPTTDDLVGSACVANGIFDCVQPVEALGVGNNGNGTVITEVATFGPVRLRQDSALEVCLSNVFSSDNVDVTVSFFNARNSAEPIATRSGTLRPGRGTCVSMDYDRVRNSPIFAEVTHSATVTTPNQPVGIVRGVAIINGIFEPVPGERRLTAVI